jgi:hypothetical protein
MAPDVVNPRTLESEVAKKILSELFDIRTLEVDEMIRLRIEERIQLTYLLQKNSLIRLLTYLKPKGT